MEAKPSSSFFLWGSNATFTFGVGGGMEVEDEYFGDDYLLLKPTEASAVGLFRFLVSADLNDRKFIDAPHLRKDLVRSFRQRWLIFISVVAQKLLLVARGSMDMMGDAMETWLNLISFNGGLLNGLLANLLRGRKVVWPDRTSGNFRSLVGNFDTRIELDKNIRPEDNKYKPALSIMAAKLSYENEAFVTNVVVQHWKMQLLGFYNFWNDYQERSSTRCVVLLDTSSEPNLVVVSFRGTDPFDADAWRTDVNLSWYDLKHMGNVHCGFMKALGLQKGQGWPKNIDDRNSQRPYAYYKTKQLLKDVLQKNDKAKFILTGHSLGGALAILFVFVLVLHEEEWLLDKLDGVYTFGQPRVGDEKFGEFMKEKLRIYDVKYFRYVHCNDMVPRLPYDDQTLMFKHFGPCLYFNSCYKGKVMREEPNKNYFSLLWVIPKYLNAYWELLRGFILPYFKGPDYKESWCQIAFRLVGLVIPGLADHGLQDYTNLVLLGSLPLDLQQQDPSLQQQLKTD